ncbi:hypothetical protein CR203_21430 [Salipaludibacillus neizhouensis]|uniref:Uncharacterized protein n=1 Tax=Salipaludibacillus neizhouensis TaxID=885475 RepID=A0A3A9KKF9_9BACI|nr:hypothetical protein [Salipaludibacillus neizhouensis]RKL65366.1 hypothetical protein CR203_21430 [Salipaludibacillus neizhouensis]
MNNNVDPQINLVSKNVIELVRSLIRYHTESLTEKQLNFILYEVFGETGKIFSGNISTFFEHKEEYDRQYHLGHVYLLHFLNYDIANGYEYYLGQTRRKIDIRIKEHERDYESAVVLVDTIESLNPFLTETLITNLWDSKSKRTIKKGSNYPSSLFNLTNYDLGWFKSKKKFSMVINDSIQYSKPLLEDSIRPFVEQISTLINRIKTQGSN